MKTFTAYVEFDSATNLYVEIVPAVSGAHTQAASLDELRQNLKEVLELRLEQCGEQLDELPGSSASSRLRSLDDPPSHPRLQEDGALVKISNPLVL